MNNTVRQHDTHHNNTKYKARYEYRKQQQHYPWRHLRCDCVNRDFLTHQESEASNSAHLLRKGEHCFLGFDGGLWAGLLFAFAALPRVVQCDLRFWFDDWLSISCVEAKTHRERIGDIETCCLTSRRSQRRLRFQFRIRG